jgi:hypothetical protein
LPDQAAVSSSVKAELVAKRPAAGAAGSNALGNVVHRRIWINFEVGV